jgi:hypothetical protein
MRRFYYAGNVRKALAATPTHGLASVIGPKPKKKKRAAGGSGAKTFERKFVGTLKDIKRLELDKTSEFIAVLISKETKNKINIPKEDLILKIFSKYNKKTNQFRLSTSRIEKVMTFLEKNGLVKRFK